MPSQAVETMSLQEKEALPLDVAQNHKMAELRNKMYTLLDTFERQKLARPETVTKYRKAVEADQSLEGLQGFYQWMTGKWQESMQRLNGLHAQINEAVQSKAAGENDRVFLLQHLILADNHDFAGEVDKIERVLKEKLDRMRDDRKVYDEIKNHPLVANTGFLKTDADTKIQIPDEKAFLELTVPERRALLKKAKEALPKAQAYAEKSGEIESKDLTRRYDKLLDEAHNKKRIIGSKTAAKFRDGFKKVDRQEKESWISEFENQMKRYEDLWGKIRTTLKGKPLERMEGLRDSMGYTELFTEYGRVMEGESKAFCERYDGKLQVFFKQRLISVHTKNAFSVEIRKKDFAEQNRYMEFLDDQMDRYRDLRTQIDALKSKNPRAWKILDKLYDSPDHGYKEIKARYTELTSGVPQTSEQDFHSKMEKLEGIRRERVRKNVIQSEEHLESRGQKEKMIYRLDQLVRHEEQGGYDQSSYEGNIRNLRREQKNRKLKTANRKQQTDATLRAQYRELEAHDEDGMHSTSKASHRFHVTEVNTGDQTKKAIQFEIGNEEAMHVFLHDENVRPSERDQVTFLARDGAEADRMTFEEIRRYRDYLKSTLPKAA